MPAKSELGNAAYHVMSLATPRRRSGGRLNTTSPYEPEVSILAKKGSVLQTTRKRGLQTYKKGPVCKRSLEIGCRHNS